MGSVQKHLETETVTVMCYVHPWGIADQSVFQQVG